MRKPTIFDRIVLSAGVLLLLVAFLKWTSGDDPNGLLASVDLTATRALQFGVVAIVVSLLDQFVGSKGEKGK